MTTSDTPDALWWKRREERDHVTIMRNYWPLRLRSWGYYWRTQWYGFVAWLRGAPRFQLVSLSLRWGGDASTAFHGAAFVIRWAHSQDQSVSLTEYNTTEVRYVLRDDVWSIEDGSGAEGRATPVFGPVIYLLNSLLYARTHDSLHDRLRRARAHVAAHKWHGRDPQE